MKVLAIYHCHISNVSRAKGSSSCATASYITGEKIYEERVGKTYNYGRNERIVHYEMMSIFEFENVADLFNSIENYEKANNSRTAKKIEVALPRELDLENQIEIVKNYVQKNLVDKGYPCTFAIHEDKEGKNPHAHILVANRQISADGKWQAKSKMEYVLDEDGNRVPIIDKKTGKQKVDKQNRKKWKRIDVNKNLLDKKEFLLQLREMWAIECNKYLDKDNQIDHRSYKEQGIMQIPTRHIGVVQQAMKKKNKVLDFDKTEINKIIKEDNKTLRMIHEQRMLVLLELENSKEEKEEEKESLLEKAPQEPKKKSLLEKATPTSYKSKGWER